MATQKAIVVYPDDKSTAIRDIPLPEVREGWVVVKVKAVALNPTDWQNVDSGEAGVGARVGCDFAGIVHQVFPGETRFNIGDRIAGMVHGG